MATGPHKGVAIFTSAGPDVFEILCGAGQSLFIAHGSKMTDILLLPIIFHSSCLSGNVQLYTYSIEIKSNGPKLADKS